MTLRLRRKRHQSPPSGGPVIEAAVCVEEFRTGAVGVLVPRWQQRAVDDPIVTSHPAFFRGLVRLEEVNDGSK